MRCGLAVLASRVLRRTVCSCSSAPTSSKHFHEVGAHRLGLSVVIAQNDGFRSYNFDKARYDKLVRDVQRYQRYVKHFRPT